MPPPSTQSTRRFLPSQRVRKSSPSRQIKTSSGSRNEPTPSGRIEKDLPCVDLAGDAKEQFGLPPRFSQGRTRRSAAATGERTGSLRQQETREHPHTTLAQALSGTHHRRDDVHDLATDDDESLEAREPDAAAAAESHNDTAPFDLLMSPKRRRIDTSNTVSDQDVKFLPRIQPSAVRPHFRAHTSTDLTSSRTETTSKPPFLIPPSPAPADQTGVPLPTVFSPHRRAAQLVPGGLATTAQQWVLEAGQAAAHNRRGGQASGFNGADITTRFVVERSKPEAPGPLIVDGRNEEAELVRAVLIGDALPEGTRANRKNIKADQTIGVRDPCWTVNVAEGKWLICVDWKAL